MWYNQYKEVINLNIAKALTELRKAKGLSRQKLADDFGISVHTYIKYENGSAKPPYETLCLLADFYGVTTDYLLGREKSPEPMEQLANQMSMQEMEADIFERWLKLSPKEREIILNVLRDIVHNDDARRNPALSRIYLGNNSNTSNTASENAKAETTPRQWRKIARTTDGTYVNCLATPEEIEKLKLLDDDDEEPDY